MASNVARRGRVLTFDGARGLGTVQDEDGRSWPFHCTRIADGSRAIDPGAHVVFDVVPGAPGRWEATGLVKLA